MTAQDTILSDLNPEQKKAVCHKDGPLLIIAGAGSGKTRVLTRRAAFLIFEGILPENILAVTFTNKAASEMKSRIRSLAKHAPVMGTFHSISAGLLRNHIQDLGLSNQFTIYDSDDQAGLVKECIKALKLDDKRFKPRQIVDKISRLKDQLIEPQTVSGPAKSFWEDQTREIYRHYQALLRKQNALDFGDLILLTVKLLRNSKAVLAHYQNLFRYILVDEYQDTNFAQYTLIKLLAAKHENICVVGDPDQSIYSWRGADISNILMFEKDYPRTNVIKLEENYRSTQNILSAANRLIIHNEGRKAKNLWTRRQEGESVAYYEALDERDEALFTVNRIREFAQQGISYDRIVIFYRVHAQSRVFEDVLRRFEVPYKIIGGISFYARREIKDILAYLRLIKNSADDQAFLRVVNVPARGLGTTSLEKIARLAHDRNQSLFDTARTADKHEDLPVPAQKKLRSFVSLIEKLRGALSEKPLSQFIPYLAEETGYEKMLAEDDAFEEKDRVENLRELATTAREMELDGAVTTLDDFLEKISLASHVEELKDDTSTLTLMTLHSAKGLEFPIVFMVGLEESLLPHANSFQDPDNLEEERRLCYVGITRAQDKLFLSSAIQRIYNGKFVNNFPSRFLEEISHPNIKRLSFQEMSSSAPYPRFRSHQY